MSFSKWARSDIVFWFSLIVAKLSFTALLILLGFQVYARWSINKDFAFLPGFCLEAIIISVFALIMGLAYAYREKQ